MSDFDIKVDIDLSEVDRIARSLNKNIEDVLKMMAFEIEGLAKQLAPYDTTALRNSIYTVTKDSNNFDVAAAAATRLRPGVSVEAHPAISGDVIARVGPCVEYAAFVELGTERMAAQPFLVPAFQKTVKEYNTGKKWKKLFE